MKIGELERKEKKLVIGLMSGTSADGIDAALTEITGCGTSAKVREKGFVSIPYSDEVREQLLRIAGGNFGGSDELCRMSFLLGQLFADACLELCRTAGIQPSDVDFVGSHGHTVWHLPQAEHYLGYDVRGTLQIGDPSLISEKLGCPVVSDFRVRDMAAGGMGAPLVPYTEFLLYRDEKLNVALQNIGGIGNITFLPAGCTLDEVFAFDTGPGNMVMDQLVGIMTGGSLRYDEDGKIAASGKVSEKLLAWMLKDDYLNRPLPKTTGRERYGADYLHALLEQAGIYHVNITDTLATAASFTAACIQKGIEKFFPQIPDRLIVGGGGAQNPVLMAHIRRMLPRTQVLRGEDIGFSSDAKEAVAFALLANETVCGVPNNAPGATGAAHPVVMGKISF